MKLKLFLTFDHELPLGKLKTSYEDSLFKPSQKVMDVANEAGVKVTFFTDILCGIRFKEWDYTNFYLPYRDQLINALRDHHDVQLHTHPHWLTTKYENGTYIPSTDFALSDFKNDLDVGGISGIIKLGIDGLQEIITPIFQDYECIAYRAGGFNISPLTKEIFEALYTHGIRYDSSIARGHYFKSSISKIDFRKLPKAGNWFINPENYHTASLLPNIFEIPIATIPKTPFEIPTKFKLKKYSNRAQTNNGEVIHSKDQTNLFTKLLMLSSSRILTFDNYTYSLEYLLRIVDYNVKKYKSCDTLMFSIISHPKTMCDYSFILMKRFIQEVQNKYPSAEFTTFSQLHKSIKQ